jgi:hypothetical protein
VTRCMVQIHTVHSVEQQSAPRLRELPSPRHNQHRRGRGGGKGQGRSLPLEAAMGISWHADEACPLVWIHTRRVLSHVPDCPEQGGP